MNSHLKSLKILNFRGLEGVSFDGLTQVNLFVGMNNSGKTSVLESLMLLLRPGDSRNWINLLNARASVVGAKSRKSAVEWLFPVIDRTFPIEHKPLLLECELSNGGASLRGVFVQTDNLSAGSEETPDISLDYYSESLNEEPRRSGGIYFDSRPADGQNPGGSRSVSHPRIDDEIRSIPGQTIELVKPHGHRTSGASLRMLLDALESPFGNSIREIFQAFDEDIVGLVQGSDEASARDYFVEHRRLGLLPLTSYGDGIRKAAYVIEHLFRAKDGILLIDEIETALHHKVQESFVRFIRSIAVDLNVQIFITTHSLETVDAVIGAFDEEIDKLAAFRLEQGKKDHVSAFPGEMLKNIREMLGQDIR
jgi:predicted ATPase